MDRLHRRSDWVQLLVSTFGILFAATLAEADDLLPRVQGAPLSVPNVVLANFVSPTVEAQAGGEAQLRHAADSDADLLSNWLKSEGYLDAHVTPELQKNGRYRWQLLPGDRWRIGACLVSPTPPEEFVLPGSGDWFRSEDYEAAKSALLAAWFDSGYRQARLLSAVARPDATNHTVTIEWQVGTGSALRIGEIRVHGARQFDASIAVRLSQLRSGDILTAARIRQAIRNIGSDTHYLSAAILPQLDQVDGERVPVVIDLSENARYALDGTLGYSSDTGLGATGAWSDRGIEQGLLDYNLHGNYSPDIGGAGMALGRSAFPGSRDHAGIALDMLWENTAGQRFRTTSGGPFVQRDFGVADHVRLDLLQKWTVGAGERIRTFEPALSLHLDRRGGEAIAERGWRADWRIAAPVQTNGNGLWFATRLDGRLYSRYGWLFASPRAGYGRTVSLRKAVPKSLMQFSGGAGSVRGYRLDSLGPTDPSGRSTGGLNAFNAGLDLLFSLTPETYPLLFADAGHVWNAPKAGERVAWSLGCGVISRLAFGPMRFDIAFPQTQQAQQPRFQIYISLGEVL